MARRGSPALYELMGRGRESKTTPVIPVAASARKPGPTRGVTPAGGGGAGGAAKAAPSGAPRIAIDPAIARILGIGTVVVVVLLGVYWLGVSRGSGNAQNEGEQAAAPTAGGDPSTGSNGAIAPGGATAQQGGGRSAVAGSGAAGKAAAPQSGGGAANQANQAANQGANQGSKSARASENQPGRATAAPTGPIDPELGPPLPPAQRGIDPRQAGLQYCVIASVLEANADKLVQFCRDRGLDAWVVPDHNGRLREITVLPGIPKSELKGELAKSLEARIRKVGALWKAAGRGNSDFEDRYFKPFNG